MGARAGRREPVRTCVVCRRSQAKDTMSRFVRTSDGAIVADRDGSAAGRGAYVCSRRGCVDRVAGRLAGALKVKTVDIDRVRQDLADLGVA